MPKEGPSKKELKQLRIQARLALVGFIRSLLGQPGNRERLTSDAPEEQLWLEGLRLASRLLFLIQLERSPAAPPFVRDRAWQNQLSPTRVLGPMARALLTTSTAVDGAVVRGLRAAFKALDQNAPGLLPSSDQMLIVSLEWNDTAAARLLAPLLWLENRGAPTGPEIPWQRFAPECLGWIYEALIALDPVLPREPSLRLAHPKRELIIRRDANKLVQKSDGTTKGIRVVEELQPWTFTVCAGLGQKTSGSYYTPAELVDFLVSETLDPLLASPLQGPSDPDEALLRLKVVDPAMGSGHFLVAACRHLARRLLENLHNRRDAGLPLATPALSRKLLEDALEQDNDRAESLARWLVARTCLYGVDYNPVAVELAKLTLWLVASSAELPLPDLANHLLDGDSLTGPKLNDLEKLPRSKRPLAEDDFAALEALRQDSAVETLRRIAAVWAGAVMLDDTLSDPDGDYAGFLEQEVGGQRKQSLTEASSNIARMLETGSRSLSFELAFPEVFQRPTPGFDAVLGNPPWDKVLPLEREFFAQYDLQVLTVPTARERAPIYARLRGDTTIAEAWQRYAEPFARTRRFIERTYRWQGGSEDQKRQVGGHADRYRYFIERSWGLLHEGGRLGLVLPNAFYATSSARGVRRLLLRHTRLELCLGFTNASRLFDIGQGQRFCLVVAQRGETTEKLSALFGLESAEELAHEGWRSRLLDIHLELLERTSPDHLCFLEVPDGATLRATDRLYHSESVPFGTHIRRVGIELYQELNMTLDSRRFSATAKALKQLDLPVDSDPRREPQRSAMTDAGWLVVHEKGTFQRYDDLIKAQPRYTCAAEALRAPSRSKPKALQASRLFRLAARSAIHASELRKSVFCLLPPGSVVGNSALCEARPDRRTLADALALLACCNSSAFNFTAKLRLGTNLNQFLLEALPIPRLAEDARRCLAHGALRLSCNHTAYRELWCQLLGEIWREGGERLSFPALVGRDRARVEAELDAVIAHLYGLSRDDYRTILEALPPLPATLPIEEQLALFDVLTEHGLEPALSKLDPYFDIPLPEMTLRA